MDLSTLIEILENNKWSLERSELRVRRSKEKIMSDILNVCDEGENVTRIVYRANTIFQL